MSRATQGEQDNYEMHVRAANIVSYIEGCDWDSKGSRVCGWSTGLLPLFLPATEEKAGGAQFHLLAAFENGVGGKSLLRRLSPTEALGRGQVGSLLSPSCDRHGQQQGDAADVKVVGEPE